MTQDYSLAAKWLKQASEHYLYTGTYERLIEMNPAFTRLRIRNDVATINRTGELI